jgi:hypothetical protein
MPAATHNVDATRPAIAASMASMHLHPAYQVNLLRVFAVRHDIKEVFVNFKQEKV